MAKTTLSNNAYLNCLYLRRRVLGWLGEARGVRCESLEREDVCTCALRVPANIIRMTDRISKCFNISQRTKTILNMTVDKPPTKTKQNEIIISDGKVSQRQQGLPEPKVTNMDSIYARSYSLTSSLFDTFNDTQTTFNLQDKTILENTITMMNETFRKEDINQDKQSNSSNFAINKDSPNFHDTAIDLICYEVMPPKDFSTRNRSRNIEYSLKEITQEDETSPINNQLDFDSDDSTRDKDYYPSDGSESQDEILDLRPNKNKPKLSRKKKIPKTSISNSQTVLNPENIISPKVVPDFEIKKPTRRNSLGSFQRLLTISASPSSRKRRNTTDIYCASQTPAITNSSETVESSSVVLDPQLSQPSRKRKKYNTSVAQRKLESINKRKLEHGVKTGCTDKCLKKCSTEISQEDKLAVNKRYWEMSWNEQHAFVTENTSVAIPKRRTTTELKRRPKRIFTLKKLDGTRVEVCKISFLTTLGYEKTNDRILHYDIKDISVDGRGQHQKTPMYDRGLLTQHVLSFNPTEYHYRREHAPLRRYLPSDINIVSMHQDYCTKYPDKKVSYELYRQQLKTMNISFSQLGHEECEMCETYNLHEKQTSHDAKSQIVADCSSCVEWAQHHEKYKTARQLYKKHKELPRNDAEIYYSTDLEKVIMLPRMDTFKSIIFCKRLIALNQTFAPIGKITNQCKPLTVIWNDSIAGRKQEDIISAFFHFLRRNRDATQIHLWLDNCTAQNKNWLLYSFLVYMINSEMICAKKLTLYYFEPGHTFMSCDQVHHQVELSMKKKGKLYDFTDFEEAVASINQNKVIVKSMAATDFINVEKYISDRRIQTSNPRAYLKDMCQVSFSRNSYDLQYKNNFNDEFISLRFMNDKFIKDPSIMKLEHRSAPKGVDYERKADILDKISSIMPVHKQLFWKELPVTLDETASTSDTSNKASRLSNSKTKNKTSRLST